jgi:hypothetical protein
MVEEKEKVICPTCKLFYLKSRVYVIDWQKSSLQQIISGYYDKNGDYIKSNVFLPVSKTFWCTYGHFWMHTK